MFRMSNNFYKSNSGQTLLELVVVVGVSVLIIGALVFATISSLRNAQFSKYQTQATKLAQERLERVRTARDRNKPISGLGDSVTSWDGSSVTKCQGNPLINEDSIWCYRISGNCDSPDINNTCYYFKLDPSTGLLNNISNSIFPDTQAEQIDFFRIAIALSDDPDDYQNSKRVTAIVRWGNSPDIHESRLTTILRRL